MLSSKTRGVFVEVSRYRLTVAITSQGQSHRTVERLAEISAESGREKIREFILSTFGNSKVRYVNARTAAYPPSRFTYRHSADTPARLKEQGYFEEVISGQLGVDIATNSVSIVNACDGTTFDMNRSLSVQRELLICGAPTAELKSIQDDILAYGIYPESLEIGSLSMMGAIMNHSRFSGLKRPVLMLEAAPAQTSLYIVSPDKVDLCRTIPVGLDSMLPALAGELGMKDEQSARSMLYSNTFDFTEMGPALLSRLLKEIKASTGFYEVQTGQTIGSVFLHLLPPGLEWVRQSMSKALAMDSLRIDLASWLDSRGVKLAEGVRIDGAWERYVGVLSLVIEHERAAEA
ncbi:MAG TPA: hypothetical protein PKI32_05705 [Opitutales bacterium]|nr:hypothetical protein [Opitutales bacterium]